MTRKRSTPFLRRRSSRLIVVFFLAALGANLIFLSLWAFSVSLSDRRLMLVLWPSVNVALFVSAVTIGLRGGYVSDTRLALRLRIGPVPRYLRENPGSPFILTFILSLLVAAATYSSNATLANDIVTNTFLLLVVGVALQAIALARKGPSE